MRECKDCGREFEPLHGNQVYCTPSCRWRHAERKRREYMREYYRKYYQEHREYVLRQQAEYRRQKHVS